MQRQLIYNEETGSFLIICVNFSFYQPGFKLVCNSFPDLLIKQFTKGMKDKYSSLRCEGLIKKHPTLQTIKDEFTEFAKGEVWL